MAWRRMHSTAPRRPRLVGLLLLLVWAALCLGLIILILNANGAHL